MANNLNPETEDESPFLPPVSRKGGDAASTFSGSGTKNTSSKRLKSMLCFRGSRVNCIARSKRAGVSLGRNEEDRKSETF